MVMIVVRYTVLIYVLYIFIQNAIYVYILIIILKTSTEEQWGELLTGPTRFNK